MYASVIRREQEKIEKDPGNHKKTTLPEIESDDKISKAGDFTTHRKCEITFTLSE
jgi:hypothetical protein